MPVRLPAHLSVRGCIKEYSVFQYCRLSPLLLWPSIVSCLETDRKEALSNPLCISLSPLLHASIHLYVSLHFSAPFPPHVCLSLFLSLFRYQTLSRRLVVFTASSHPPIQWRWCLGNRVHTDTCTHTLYSQLFFVLTLSFTRYETLSLGQTCVQPSLLCKTFDFCLPLCHVGQHVYVYTAIIAHVEFVKLKVELINPVAEWPSAFGYQYKHQLYCDLIDSYLCFAPALQGMNRRNMSHSDLSPLNKPIYQVAPRSLVNVGLFITRPLLHFPSSLNSKKTFNRKTKKKNLITKKKRYKG